MSETHLFSIEEECSIQFILGAKDNIYRRQNAANGYSKGSWIVPLIWAKIQITKDGYASQSGLLNCEESRTTNWVLCQICTYKYKCSCATERRGQHIIN